MTDDASPSSFGALVLLSTLRTAVEVRHAISERRAGRDPSGQEDGPSVEAYLRGVLPELHHLLGRLRLSLVVARSDEAAFVQAFEDRLVLARLARELHVVHQRLLSLYPAVPESLIEEARLRQREAERLAAASGPAFEQVLTGWVDRAASFCEGLTKALESVN
jgi:hypothetical protein